MATPVDLRPESPQSNDWFIPNPETPASLEIPKVGERTLYIGCVHGGDIDFFHQMESLVDLPDATRPDIVVFGGDIGGAKDRRTIIQKQLFYNFVMNHAKPLLREQPTIQPSDLLDTQITQPNGFTHTIRQGVTSLLTFAVTDMVDQQADQEFIRKATYNLALEQMAEYPYNGMPDNTGADSDTLMYNYIQWILHAQVEDKPGLNSGTWVSTLPQNIREAYLHQYRETQERFGNMLLWYRLAGIEPILLMGNEDMPESFEIMSRGLDGFVDATTHLESIGFPFIRTLSAVEDPTTVHIMVPFTALKYPETVTPEILDTMSKTIDKARTEGKKIVMVAHHQLEWSRHDKGVPAGEPANFIPKLLEWIQMFQPDEYIYPHKHDEMPGLPDIDAKYISMPTSTLVTYLPLMAVGMCDRQPGNRNLLPTERFRFTLDPIRRIK